jgi:hypothetical protein
VGDGSAQAIIHFGLEITINNSNAGVDFVLDTDTSVPAQRKDIFIVNLNTLSPE